MQRVLSILIYHRVRAAPDPLFPAEVDVELFSRQMAWLRRWFRVMRLSDAVRCMASGELPQRAACVTFDDGYTDNAQFALPILQRVGIPATFFIATGFLEGGCMWNDRIIESVRESTRTQLDLRDEGLGVHPVETLAQRRLAVRRLIDVMKYRPRNERERLTHAVAAAAGISDPSALMMTVAQVRQLHDAGMEVGAHTVTHPVLAACDIAVARTEIDESRRQLEAIVHDRVSLFAYPNGRPDQDYRREHTVLVRELGFDAAVSTSPGVADGATDRFQLPRFTPWQRNIARFGASVVANRFKRPILSSAA